MQKPLPTKFSDETGNYDGNDPQGSANLTFTRASNATRVGPNGLEKVRTNLVLYSEQFDNAAWVKTDCTVTPNTTANPINGALTADTVVFNGANDQISQTFNVSNHTFSVYVKGTAGETIVVGFGAGAATLHTLTGDFDRVSATGSSAFFVYIGTFAGATARTINVFGAQLETGDIATDYLATTTSARSTFAGITVDGTSVPNVPRLDYSGGATCPSLLLEPTATALNYFSEQADNAYWIKEGTTISANTTATLDPSGYSGADKLQEDSSTGRHRYGRATFPSGIQRTFSVFAKKAERDYVALFENNAVGAQLKGVIFNLNTGAVSLNNDAAYYLSPTITALANGWYRCSVTWTSYSLSVPSVGVSSDGLTNSYTGTTGSGVYVWGANLTATSYLQSYIPTLSAEVTRVAESCSRTSASAIIGQSEGTLFVEMDKDFAEVSERYIAIGDGGTANRIMVIGGTGGSIRGFISNSGVVQFDNSTGSAVGNHKIALAYANNNVAFYVDGVQIALDTSATIPAVANLYVGASEIGLPERLNGGLKQALLFKTRLTNAQLAELTTL